MVGSGTRCEFRRVVPRQRWSARVGGGDTLRRIDPDAEEDRRHAGQDELGIVLARSVRILEFLRLVPKGGLEHRRGALGQRLVVRPPPFPPSTMRDIRRRRASAGGLSRGDTTHALEQLPADLRIVTADRAAQGDGVGNDVAGQSRR